MNDIPTATIDLSKPIVINELLEKLEERYNDAYKRQLQRAKDARAWWKNLTLEQAEDFLHDLETNPQKYRTMILDEGFYKYYPPLSIILMKVKLKEFVAKKRKE